MKSTLYHLFVLAIAVSLTVSSSASAQNSDEAAIRTVVVRQGETWNRSAASYIDNAAKLTTHAVNLPLEAARLTNGSRAIQD